MKKIMNVPEDFVLEMCNGIVQAHPELVLNKKFKIITRKHKNPNKVSLISGGGSGHEPAHAGFVGKGMLDAAVCGDVFASPSQIQVYQAIKETAGDKGTLLIIKNYSGDMMNFKNAAYLASEDGIEVEYVRVDDDIAVKDSLYTVGRRGVAGTVFVHKIAGAAAERGMNLADIKTVAEKTIANVKSIGFAMTSCTVPAKGTPTFELGKDEMEYGVGIHGEPGIQREKLVPSKELAERMIDALFEELLVKKGDVAALLVNGFGATPMQELYILNNNVTAILDKKGILVKRVFVGNYMTSIDMAGASLSILKLDAELEELLSEESDTPALKIVGATEPIIYTPIEKKAKENSGISYRVETDAAYATLSKGKITFSNMVYIIDRMSQCIIENEVLFCELDSYAGDGDFGMSVAKGFKQLKADWKELVRDHCTIGEFLDACSLIIMEHCGGASGPIWGSAFRAAGKNVGNKTEITASEFAQMLQAAVKGIQATGERSFGRGAIVGDKTLMDALIPCTDMWITCAQSEMQMKEIFVRAAKAAVEGAKKTEKIVARMGRASTVGDRSLGYPDAGAYGLGVIFTDLAGVLK